MFEEVIATFELHPAGPALEVPHLRVDGHVVAELVLVAQLFPANLEYTYNGTGKMPSLHRCMIDRAENTCPEGRGSKCKCPE